jgi:membrane-associated phospholipid phosphatase
VRWQWVAAGYVAYLAIVSLTRPRFRRARRPLMLAAAAACVSIAVGFAASRSAQLAPILEIVLPAAVLLAGYWLSGMLFVEPDERMERWLRSVDAAILARTGALAWFRRAPRAVIEYFELSYLLVYVIVPAGAVTLLLGGHPEQVGRFWTVVLLAEFSCYAMLPWIQTRPPRAIEEAPSESRRPFLIRSLNLAIVNRASIQVNTLPSGHTAGAFAAALAVGSTMPAAGAVSLVFAASIAVAAVLGRYHYVVDSVLGLLVGGIAWAIST